MNIIHPCNEIESRDPKLPGDGGAPHQPAHGGRLAGRPAQTLHQTGNFKTLVNLPNRI